MKRILFVCTGNTCRSPMAEHLFKAKATDTYAVQSAGIAAIEGQDAAEHVHHVLKEKGIAVEHKSQHVTPELIAWADLILTMTGQHQLLLQEQFPEKKEQILTLKQYVTGQTEDTDIADPFGGTLELYRQTRNELDELLEQLLEKEKQENK